ncbi:MAG TPA: multifunctional oxoglutarate decarboxylase/oxoglutarate dehydrogenase thiamine pyrophosphate-binding subunit/dihydrolipoyllysine-residue succinyltransferase subunit [Gemmatimonadales bacterium]|nr:multifunctional oxoglutarate decarboxylase/oxoglutarate dehydrogenase thiamine pyrophosphate-binding subunit/dihydrolipoyllysine-residue succinyltransferase subunit [Gemmatimonadales bacterium]
MDWNVFETANAGFAQVMYEEYLRDPNAVGPEWRRLFDAGLRGAEPDARHPSVMAAGGTAGRRDGGSTASANGTASSTGASAPAVPPARPAPLPANAQPIKGPAAKLVANMNESLTVPTATTFRELSVAALEARRKELNAAIQAAGRTEKISFTHLIAWAIVQATKQHPVMGHTLAMSDGTPHRVVPEHIALGIAVDVTRKDGSRGLVVPVIKQAETMDFAAFHAAYEALVEKARTNKLMPDDFAGATMSLTNPGGIGTVASVPRLMAGQGSIIAVGAIAYPPEFAHTAPETLRQLGLGKVMTVTSTYDHRVIQGAESGEFLKTLDGMLQGNDGFYETVFQALGLTAKALTLAAAKPLPLAAPTAGATAAGTAGGLPPELVAAAMRLVEAVRSAGHTVAHLNPLTAGQMDPAAAEALDPATYGLTEQALAAIPAAALGVEGLGATLAEALPRLKAIYCGTTAYEFAHITDRRQREWLRERVERGEFAQPLPADERRWLLRRLTAVETFERFLHKAYLGQKRFSGEGVDSVVPMLDTAMDLAARAGAREVVLGMAHRGRLNVLVHVAGRPYEMILGEFEGAKHADEEETEAEEFPGTGDVKYHLGAEGTVTTPSGHELAVTLAPNPSHLEFVGAVVNGRARARQTDRTTGQATHDPRRVLPVILHGDAAFAGQGVVAETLNMSGLAGYAVGGTLHIIENNQVGFTTDWVDARSTRYASDMAKGFDVPVVHVNADDPEACLGAVRLLMAYRAEFGRDVLIDLVGYRRHGHNEGDEPTYTQPTMYATIKDLPTVRAKYAERLAAAGVVSADEAEAEVKAVYDRLVELQQGVKARAAALKAAGAAASTPAPRAPRTTDGAAIDTRVPADALARLNERLLAWPEGFTVNPKLKRQLERRRTAAGPEGGIDWGHAEALAFASLLVEGTPLRLTGQDVERGTFSHRHALLHDVDTNAEFAPLQHLADAQASFEIHNSPLSELAAIGFEYGYNIAAPEALVLWEAQFGDFVNGAQVMLDQFVSASRAKWGETSRLTLLLPHGFEGQGPEHSSARLERFLQLAAEDNLRVANCTTPAQYFHLLRRQAKDRRQRPLVVMTPKSLLRLPQAASRLEELAEGAFHPVLDDAAAAPRAGRVARIVLCSGKVYYDLLAEAEKMGDDRPALVRVEQLYPFPGEALQAVFAKYPEAREIVWAQEEPRNMGAWTYMEPRLREILPEGATLEYVGRPERASPAEGYLSAHLAEQHRIVATALAAPKERGPFATTAAAGEGKG